MLKDIFWQNDFDTLSRTIQLEHHISENRSNLDPFWSLCQNLSRIFAFYKTRLLLTLKVFKTFLEEKIFIFRRLSRFLSLIKKLSLSVLGLCANIISDVVVCLYSLQDGLFMQRNVWHKCSREEGRALTVRGETVEL